MECCFSCSIQMLVILPERQSLEKWSIGTTDLGDSGSFADVELVLDCLSCTCHASRTSLVTRHVHMLRARHGVATIRERRLFRSSLPEVRRLSLFESGV